VSGARAAGPSSGQRAAGRQAAPGRQASTGLAADLLAQVLPSLRAYSIPMPTRFRGITVREGALLRGPAGWGEFSPFAEYQPPECARWLACALESACLGWPPPRRDRIGVNVTVPAVSPGRARGIVARSGCRTAKVKVAEHGQPESDDIARVAAVREAIGPAGRIRVDANGGWDVGQAARMLQALAPLRLEYAEQPCATLPELAELRQLTDVPLAADESIRRAEDPLAVRAAGAADIVVLKAQPLGGVRAALAIAAACELPVVVSSAVETSAGLAAGVALAAALPELRYDCGLATMSLLGGDVTARPLAASGGFLPVRAVEPDDELLTRWAADPEPWRARILAAAGHLDDSWLELSPGVPEAGVPEARVPEARSQEAGAEQETGMPGAAAR
jgi:O-succinylbenzoate synthase